jgi:hypothetical protein
MKVLKILLLVVVALLLADFAFAQTWTQTSAPSTNWVSIASSADGKILAAVNNILPDPLLAPANPLFVSTSSGAVWTTSGPEDDSGWNWWRIASSADGKIQLVASVYGSLNISTDSGTTWVRTGPPGNYIWNGVASSADGSKLVAVAYNEYSSINNGWIYASSNFGTNWIRSNTTLNTCSAVASSANGNILVAGTMYDSIHISTNSGATWSATGSPVALLWTVACSADGSKIMAASSIDGPIYMSADSGSTWTQTSAPNMNWQSVASSADGSKLVAASDGGLVYTSTNSGVTWVAGNVPSASWQSVASSADGNKLVAVAQNGGIWTSQTMPSLKLNLTPSSTSLTLGWIIPSTNFVLQQSSNLVSWADVTNAPILNLTNLQNEVTLSPSNSSGFYRLKTP